MKIKHISIILFTVFFIAITLSASGQIKLPKLISNGMVLQRNTNVRIWGWAAPDEKISVNFIKSEYNTVADKNGDWFVELDKSEAGGPYTMTIKGSNTIILQDILVGEVWICSGQSNMELTMKRVSPLYEDEIANCENKNIRYFQVPKKYNFISPQTDLEYGEWKSPDPENVLLFAAVSYFFANELYNTYKVPVGIINASLGGSPAEAWISEDAIKAFPEYYNETQRFKDSMLIKKIQTEDNERINKWYKLSGENDAGYNNPDEPWFKSNVDLTGWKEITVPGLWTSGELKEVNGVVWFRREFEIPESMAGKPAGLLLGRIVDADSAFVNETYVGSTGYQYPPRRYQIPAGVLKKGKNTIVVRVISNIGTGGFVTDKPYEITADNEKIDLKGEWKYNVGTRMEPLQGSTFIRWKPVGLYNAMITPLLNYSIKGVAWYQGESNVERASEYFELLPSLISNWREKWEQDDLPFIVVQLPNFMEEKSQPDESEWAMLRNAQFNALKLPNTALVVAIDIGEWNDIHPLNKKDLGYRIALAARKLAYDENNLVSSGPLYKSMEIDGNKIILSFSDIGSGLKIKNGNELKYFSIAGSDKNFVWAKAKIEGDKVVVWNDKIQNPIAVRYAWADNPAGANLYNKEDIPASPFRTDDWER